MTITISDPELLGKLSTIEEYLEVVRPDGTVIGAFSPKDWGKPPPGFVSPISDEEIEERLKTFDGQPLGDFFKELESKESK